MVFYTPIISGSLFCILLCHPSNPWKLAGFRKMLCVEEICFSTSPGKGDEVLQNATMVSIAHYRKIALFHLPSPLLQSKQGVPLHLPFQQLLWLAEPSTSQINALIQQNHTPCLQYFFPAFVRCISSGEERAGARAQKQDQDVPFQQRWAVRSTHPMPSRITAFATCSKTSPL